MTHTAEQRSDPTPRREYVRWLLWPLAYAILRLAAPYIPAPGGVAGTVIATVLFLLVPLLWIRDVARMRPPTGLAIALFLVFGLLWAEILLGEPAGLIWALPWRRHPDARLLAGTVARPFADLCLITAASFLGAALSRIVRDPKMLLPITVVGALVDYWGVYYGTTHYAVQNMRGLVTNLSASIPSLGGAKAPGGLEPVSDVGFGDWFFLTMFMAIAFRYDLQPRRTFWTLLALLIPSMLLVLLSDRVQAVPAVVPMAVAVLAVNWKRLRLTREEAFATLYAMLMVAAMIAGYTLWARAGAPRAETSMRPAAPTSVGAILDGDLSTAFRSSGPLTKSESVVVDFRRPRMARGVAVLFSSDSGKGRPAPRGALDVSGDGSAWTRVGSIEANPARLTFKPREIRYVRISFEPSKTPVTVSEVVTLQ
jgi:hypothetical protein